ncbi:hypothetical protein [Nocardioides sp. CER19]|uniref:hypothetical protein n=1 Tax=Nocardioides sp. CER19 TaxID=3038538 RepID=UPI00244CEE4C|nr:hypothetical protein [Nocardioides sp. CER19]MDH2414606.1 hypothetical protein [Nocardioides sp. CER19]
MDMVGLILMIVAVVFVVVLILLFERKRAEGIERDLRSRDGSGPPSDEPEQRR